MILDFYKAVIDNLETKQENEISSVTEDDSNQNILSPNAKERFEKIVADMIPKVSKPQEPTKAEKQVVEMIKQNKIIQA